LSGNNNNLNSDSSNQNSKIIKLQNEISNLNSKIIDKINAINAIDTVSNVNYELINLLKEIVISQREEINLKNDQIKKLELKFTNFAAKINLADSIELGVNDQLKIIEDYEEKISELNTTIEEVLKKNAENQEIINKLREESNSEFWEEKISELNKISIDLSDENASLRNDLEKVQKKNVNEEINIEILDLKRLMKDLKEENNKLEEKNRMLKAALLMTVDTETKNITDSPNSLTGDSEVEVSSENNIKGSIPEGPSKVRSLEDLMESSERKRQCPQCGASGAFILEIDDKSTVIYQDMGSKIYGKKYKCGDCRYEWK